MESVVKQGTEFLKREGRRVQNLLKGKVIRKKIKLNHNILKINSENFLSLILLF